MRAKTLNGGFQLNCPMLCDVTYPHIPVTEVFKKSYTECGLIFCKRKQCFVCQEYQDHTQMHEKKGQPRSMWPVWWILLATCSTSASLFFLPDTPLYISQPYNRVQWKPTPFVVQKEILACLSQSWNPPCQGRF